MPHFFSPHVRFFPQKPENNSQGVRSKKPRQIPDFYRQNSINFSTYQTSLFFFRRKLNFYCEEFDILAKSPKLSNNCPLSFTDSRKFNAIFLINFYQVSDYSSTTYQENFPRKCNFFRKGPIKFTGI